MDMAQVKAIQAMLARRTAENTASPKLARAWIMRDGIHRQDGSLRSQFKTSTEKQKQTA